MPVSLHSFGEHKTVQSAGKVGFIPTYLCSLSSRLPRAAEHRRAMAMAMAMRSRLLDLGGQNQCAMRAVEIGKTK